MLKGFFTLPILFFSTTINAIPCYFTLVKDSCWANYNVSADVVNAADEKTLVTVSIPKGKFFGREQFACQPQQNLGFTAVFSPTFWADDAGVVYSGIHKWSLPESIKPTEVAWNITLCFPRDFSEVPLPPDAKGDCHCDMEGLPPINP